MTVVHDSSEGDTVADPRYTLTDDEHYHVLRLKELCDKEGVAYKSIFELAKYSLVCTSVKNANKRLKESFNRLRKKREFERKYKLDELDLFESLEVVEEGMPNWIQNCGMLDGKWVVGYDGADVDGKFLSRVKDGFERLCLVEMTRYDLAAADLEEARQGFYVVSTGKVLKGNPLNHARMMMKLRVLFDKMNANRVKGIFYEAPNSLSFLFGTVIKIMPAKIRDRIHVSSKFANMEVQGKKISVTNFSTRLGGKYNMSTKQWMELRKEKYATSEAEVEL